MFDPSEFLNIREAKGVFSALIVYSTAVGSLAAKAFTCFR
jgi:hypothetical protein